MTGCGCGIIESLIWIKYLDSSRLLAQVRRAQQFCIAALDLDFVRDLNSGC